MDAENLRRLPFFALVGAFGVVAPSGVFGREAVERRRQILEHRRVGIFLDRQRRRGVADEQRHRAFSRAGLLHEFRNLGGEIDKAAPGGLDRQERGDDGVCNDRRWRGAGE